MLQKDGSPSPVPDRMQLWIWQLPIAFLNGSVYCFVSGLAVLVWNSASASNLDIRAADTKVCGVMF
jgi:hypothetical protein